MAISKGCGQWLYVQVENCGQQCSSGVDTGTGAVGTSVTDMDSGVVGTSVIDMDSGIKLTLTKFAGDTKLWCGQHAGGKGGHPEGPGQA